MNLKYIILFLLSCAVMVVKSQDRIYFKDGKVVNGKIVSVGANTVSYKDSANAVNVITISKSELVLAEYKNGSIFIFGSETATSTAQATDYNETRQQRKERKMKEWKDYEAKLPDNILGFYLPELALGRFTVSYERLLANKSIGVVIPASLTYNLFSPTSTDSATTAYNYKKGVNFITGLDVNFYTDLKPGMKFFVGPRLRYGTDMFLGGIKGYTAQIQNGIFRSKGEHFVSSISVGFGFFKPSEDNLGYKSNQVYPWGSINWRLGFRL